MSQRPRSTVRLFGLTVDELSLAETVDRVEDFIREGGVHQHVAVNVDKVTAASRDPRLRDIINGSDLVSADGLPIVWASRWVGRPLRERVTGVDLMFALIPRAEKAGHRVFFLGAREGVLEAVLARLQREHPGLLVAGVQDGYWPDGEDERIAHAVAATRPDILFVALPSPRKERFIAAWKDVIGAPFVMGVGGSFDVYAGRVKRAPRWLQRVGGEWLFRLLQEPSRLWRRYLVADLRFIPLVLRELLAVRGQKHRVEKGLAARSMDTPGPLRVLVVSNLYPSKARPTFGTFMAVRVDALRRAGVEVGLAAIRDEDPHRRIAQKYLRLAADAMRHGIRALLARRRYDVVEAHIAFPTGLLAWPVAMTNRARLVLFVHGTDVSKIARRSPLHRIAFRFLFQRASIVVVNSDHMRAVTEQAIGHADPRIVVKSPGIDLALFAAAGRPSAREGILYVGRLAPEKGVATLIEAMAILASRGEHSPLTLVGGGELEDALRRRAGELGLRVLFEGSLPPVAVAGAVRSCRVLVVPSTREGLGLVALEGMAAGAIVVASKAGGLVETVIDGVTGVSTPANDAGQLADAIERALTIDADPVARERIETAGRALAAEHAIDRIVEQTIELYRRRPGSSMGVVDA